MESEELRSLINGYLFVPISEKMAEQLHGVIDTQVSEIDRDTVTKYAKAVFNNQTEWKFKNAILTKYKELYGEVLNMPNVVFLILEGYMLRHTLESVDITDDKKAQFSLIVRSCAVTRKGNWNGIVCSRWLIEMYDYYERFAKKNVISSIAYNSLLKAVVPRTQWNETGLEITEKAVYDEIRCLCADGIREKLNRYVSSFEFRNICSPFAKAYLLVKRMVKEWNWKYISDSPIERLRGALGEDAKKRKQLGNIAAEVRDKVAKEQLVKPIKGSSLLLARISEGKNTTLDNRMFSSLEFGVYLYYELLLETFNN